MNDILKIVEKLEEWYPTAECALHYEGEPWKLLIMARLSAQCTDVRVNLVCQDLFAKYPTLQSFADADLLELEQRIRPCGLYRTKAKSIKEACNKLLTDFDGQLPQTMEELLTLPGVGRKISNLLLGDIYHKPAIVTDTHCIRLAGRFGMCPPTEKNPLKIERILVELIPPEKQSDFCHRLVLFGRDYCTARKPKCEKCPLREWCKEKKNEM